MAGITGIVGFVGATCSGEGGAAAYDGAGTAGGGCLLVSADLTSIIAFGSSHRASAWSGLSEISRDSLVYAPARSPCARMITPVPEPDRIITLPLNLRSLKKLRSARMSTQAAYSSVYIGRETVSSYRPSISS